VHDNPTDGLLARRAAAGDAIAFRALYERHARGIYLLAYPLLDRDGASDVVQDVFMTVWSRGHQFDEQRGSFRTWLTAIARHRILDLARRRARDARMLAARGISEQIEELIDSTADVADNATRSVQATDVVHALGTLPPLQRRALVLVYFGGYTHRELAELLDWPLGTVKKRVWLGLRKLAVELGHLSPESLAAAEEATNEL
jgi:RNA polymerase sigma-70 factor (ECF subfamily)